MMMMIRKKTFETYNKLQEGRGGRAKKKENYY
jgi:hypothetical protein